jgi:hypothetical protein
MFARIFIVIVLFFLIPPFSTSLAHHSNCFHILGLLAAAAAAGLLCGKRSNMIWSIEIKPNCDAALPPAL